MAHITGLVEGYTVFGYGQDLSYPYNQMYSHETPDTVNVGAVRYIADRMWYASSVDQYHDEKFFRLVKTRGQDKVWWRPVPEKKNEGMTEQDLNHISGLLEWLDKLTADLNERVRKIEDWMETPAPWITAEQLADTMDYHLNHYRHKEQKERTDG